MKVAILGDTHIPGRAREIPGKLLDEMKKFRPEKIFFTGDFGSLDVLKALQKFCPVTAVKGNADFLELPETLTFEIMGIKFCLLHGHQAKPAGDKTQLQNLARYFGAEVLVCGHTHTPEVYMETRTALVINPGSATGVRPAKGGSLILAEILEGGIVNLRLLVLEDADEGRKLREEAFRFDII